MSNHSNNSVAEMLPMQFELVWGLKNGLETMFKKEAEQQKKQEEEAKASAPSIPNFNSIANGIKVPSIPHY